MVTRFLAVAKGFVLLAMTCESMVIATPGCAPAVVATTAGEHFGRRYYTVGHPDADLRDTELAFDLGELNATVLQYILLRPEAAKLHETPLTPAQAEDLSQSMIDECNAVIGREGFVDIGVDRGADVTVERFYEYRLQVSPKAKLISLRRMERARHHMGSVFDFRDLPEAFDASATLSLERIRRHVLVHPEVQ